MERAISFSARVLAPEGVMVRELDGEAVLLDLKTEHYFGLNEVGTRMWQLLTASPSIQIAYEALLDEYEVEPGQLRRDLIELVQQLSQRGLVELYG